MALIGLLITFAGFLISLFSLTLSDSPYGRLGLVVAGIAVSLFGIIALVNKAYLKDAIWKK